MASNTFDKATGKTAALEELASGMVCHEAQIHASRDRAVAALALLVDMVRRHRTTGQFSVVTAFLAGLFNGERFPFDLTELRRLDDKYAAACLDLMNYDRFGKSELHHWGPLVEADLQMWLVEDGHYYLAQQRRIGRELYRQKFPDGHPDEGAQG